jgi:hypothetical protein
MKVEFEVGQGLAPELEELVLQSGKTIGELAKTLLLKRAGELKLERDVKSYMERRAMEINKELGLDGG